jgi:hypothetical protein
MSPKLRKLFIDVAGCPVLISGVLLVRGPCVRPSWGHTGPLFWANNAGNSGSGDSGLNSRGGV